MKAQSRSPTMADANAMHAVVVIGFMESSIGSAQMPGLVDHQLRPKRTSVRDQLRPALNRPSLVLRRLNRGTATGDARGPDRPTSNDSVMLHRLHGCSRREGAQSANTRNSRPREREMAVRGDDIGSAIASPMSASVRRESLWLGRFYDFSAQEPRLAAQ